MDLNDKIKMAKESDCPKCSESEPHDWNPTEDGFWKCRCNNPIKINKKEFEKIVQKYLSPNFWVQ